MADLDQDDADSLYNDHEGTFGEDGVRRPMNAFFIFCKRHRDVVREKYPHLENRSITKILGEWWANLDVSEKFSYTTLAKQYKEAFMKAHPDFKWYKLPTPPARTLITRPSNKTKKEKSNSKFGSCGPSQGKVEDEDCLDGLSSLISPVGMDTMPDIKVDCHDTAISLSSHILSPASNNILKPPKKRYLVNGEFKCRSSTEMTLDTKEDDPTQNACSALLELAEVCANSANPLNQQHAVPEREQDRRLLQPFATAANTYCFDSSATLQSLQRNTLSPFAAEKSDPQKSVVGPTSSSYPKATVTLNPGLFIEPTIQDQPLDLCKGKGKTFTASNQQLIDHLVDKFLCNVPSASPKPVSETSSLKFSPGKMSSMNKIKQICHGYTLSNAIESAIDKAYSNDKDLEPLQSVRDKAFGTNKDSELLRSVRDTAFGTTEDPKPLQLVRDRAYCAGKDLEPLKSVGDQETAQNSISESMVQEKTEVVFIDKIKKACLASSHKKSPEKPKFKRYIIPSSLKEPEIKNSTLPAEKDLAYGQNTESSMEQNEFMTSEVSSNNDNVGYKRTDGQRFSSSKYYSKFVSPPKKSRVWCNLFMKEQLKTSDSDSSMDGKKGGAFDMASPIRRNSQRTCKGQRYQALITEGLLQSTKERKQLAGKKPFSVVEKVKTKTLAQESAQQLPRTKRKKRDSHDRTKNTTKMDGVAQKVFNLNEKIASLPKCSIEILDKKKKLSPGNLNVSKAIISVSSERSLKKQISPKDELASPKQQVSESSSSKGHQLSEDASSTSSGRFKTGGFDLEQHIASLPKCDIEVLNKKRNRKE